LPPEASAHSRNIVGIGVGSSFNHCGGGLADQLGTSRQRIAVQFRTGDRELR
jgi:hypothetical protein